MKRDLLYVDDELDNCIVFEATFEDQFRVLTANSGEEALEILEQYPIPVVVADQRMPRMTGVELFEQLRQLYPFTKRIILTGYSDPAAMIDAVNKGQVFHFVMKPWEHHHLLSILIRAFEAHDLGVANANLTDRLVASERHALLGHATARITHEINNQLCVFPLLESIAHRHSDDAELVEIASFAKMTYARLVGLIEEVRNFMRFENEEFTRQPISLEETVRELVAFLRYDKSIPQQQLTVQIDTDVVVLGNKVKLQQVLVNLLKNAAYALGDSADGRIELTLKLENEEVVVSVADTGCGMDAETLERIWEPFFTTKGADGTGLGLDISRRLIDGHEGVLECESTLGEGTVFTIRLPAHTSETVLDVEAGMHV